MAYHDLYFKTQNPELALQAIPPLLAALGERRARNMIGPLPARAAVMDGKVELLPAVGEPGWHYAAVRTQRDPAEVLANVDLAAFGVVVATRDEVEPVCGVWA